MEDLQIYPFLSDSSLYIFSREYDGDMFVSDPTSICPLKSLKKLKKLLRKEEYMESTDTLKISFYIDVLEETLEFTLNRKRIGCGTGGILYKISCTAMGYTNNHDGYCSGNECELTKINEPLSFIVRLTQDELISLSTEEGYNESAVIQYLQKQLDKHEAKFDNLEGSGYCENNPESEKLGISTHETSISYSNFSIDKY